jgi:hypothetical protein
MAATLARLRRHFGAHTVPPLLEALVRHAARAPSFSGDLELDDSDGADVAQVVIGHLHDRAVAACGDEVRARLALFARAGDGSTYGLWFPDDKRAKPAVVFLDSEGAHDGVIAASLADFLALLRLDLDDVGRFSGVARDPDEPHAEDHAAFLRWADKLRVPRAPAKPKQLVAAARRAHPGFARWWKKLRARCEALDGKATPAKPAPVEDLTTGALRLEIVTTAEQLGPAVRELVEHIARRDAALAVTSQLRLGLTETRAVDVHESGVIPPDVTRASELRVSWKRRGDAQRTLILERPEGRRKTWSITFWMYPHPLASPDATVDMTAFEAVLGATGAIKQRAGNAARAR